jgi:hypothetical protein
MRKMLQLANEAQVLAVETRKGLRCSFAKLSSSCTWQEENELYESCHVFGDPSLPISSSALKVDLATFCCQFRPALKHAIEVDGHVP